MGFNHKLYLDTKKTGILTKPENNTNEELSQEWENFEHGIIKFVTQCKSYLGKLISLK